MFRLWRPERDKGGDVHERSQDAHDDHDRAVDVRRRAEPPHALDGDDAGEHEERGAVDLRRQDLRAPKPKVNAPFGGCAATPRRQQRERGRRGVGEHVRGVLRQRQRAGEQSGDDLDRHEAGDQEQRDRQPAPIGLGRWRMGVASVGKLPMRMGVAGVHNPIVRAELPVVIDRVRLKDV